MNEAVTLGASYTLIRDLPSGERPRERLAKYGPGVLSASELLAILLRTGSARESALALGSRLLARCGGLAELARAPFAALVEERGLGEAKACQLLAALELGRRVAAAAPEDRPLITHASDVARLLQPEMAPLEQESLRVVLLDTRCRVISMREVYRGTVGVTATRAAELFREAVLRNAPGIILVHNHPSGDPAPSVEDARLTRTLAEAGAAIEVELLDHVIIGFGEGRFVSMKQQLPSLFRTVRKTRSGDTAETEADAGDARENDPNAAAAAS